tara:strand:+ start:246 stop:431 length:186 start_codon:yes stop_codon:yes gene_type:complete
MTPYIPLFVYDNRGDVWRKLENGGYVHRMYYIYINIHPLDIKTNDDIYLRILHEDIKRLSK